MNVLLPTGDIAFEVLRIVMLIHLGFAAGLGGVLVGAAVCFASEWVGERRARG